jgi:hypothetical protein
MLMSKYVCITPNCAIALSKAVFPTLRNCPVCQQSLKEVSENAEISDLDEKLISGLPYVIAYPLKRTLLEKHASIKINLFKDTFQNYLKYLGLIAASEFFNSSLKDKKMVALFHQTLAQPSFGSWNQYIRETLNYLIENQHNFFCPDILSYYEFVETGKKRKLFKGEIEFIDSNGDVQIKKQEATAIGMLINFRNRYLGHGLTLDEGASQKLWDEYYPIFKDLLEKLTLAIHYPMFKHEHGESYLLSSAEISPIEKGIQTPGRVWIENKEGESMEILPFFVVPGEVSISKEEKEQILTYESYTGKTIKFFSPEGTEKQTSGKILEKLNLLLREKQKEKPYSPDSYTKEVFLNRIADENKLILDTLISEKKVIPGVYVHREEMEIKLREWIGARANIFFIAAEAGSGKTNLLVEIQRQYLERNLSSLLIRACRMEKQSLKEQIAYLLNLDSSLGLINYTAISGTQAEPTFILIDGLNEASNAEEIWQEVLELSQIFVAGSLKFIITSRANSKADIERYTLTKEAEIFIYGENKERENGLAALVYWLTPLNMVEMKTAWEDYVKKDKNKFKPLFAFEDLATFDRLLYNQISNPLVLRLFLETYLGKKLPEKGNQHLNIWKDWFGVFSVEEQTFMELLAAEIWEKGENELLLDDLLKHETLKSYLTSDVINSPYHRLKNLGWISRYVKDMTIYAAFTVEGALFYLLGIKLLNQFPKLEITTIKTILEGNNKLKKSAIESFLCNQSILGDIGFATQLIDSNNSYIKYLIYPLITHFKFWGVEKSIEKILLNESQNDWKFLKVLVDEFENLNMFKLKSDSLRALIKYIKFDSLEKIHIGIYASMEAEKDGEDGMNLMTKLKDVLEKITTDVEMLDDYGASLNKFGEKLEALECSNSCIKIRLVEKGGNDLKLANSYLNSSYMYLSLEQFVSAEECAKKALDILKTFHKNDYIMIAKAYNIFGMIMARISKFKESYNYHNQSLDIKLKNLGTLHSSVANSYYNLGFLFYSKNEFKNSLDYYLKAYNIKLKIYGLVNESTYNSCFMIAENYSELGENSLSITFYEQCIKISLALFGAESKKLALTRISLGYIYIKENKNEKANYYFEKGLNSLSKKPEENNSLINEFYKKIGQTWSDNGNYLNALKLYKKGLNTSYKNDFYFKIGNCLFAMGKYESSINAYLKGFIHEKKGAYPFKIAQCYEALNDKVNALDYYIQSATIRKEDPKVGLAKEATQEAISNAKKIAKELGKEDDLPEWMIEN